MSNADLVRATCPECGSDKGCPADDITPRWEHDAVRIRLGFDVEGRRCPNCGADHSDGPTGAAVENTWPWRTGAHVGRTIYACPPGSSYRNGEVLIGMMDSYEIAAEAVARHNAHIDGSAP